ncbi:amidohydrolase family protein [Streptomyces sp. NPDC006706]|uniref:amidohydrolase family protein n=1 Tax=Streptomyces sp. NPDC006706 TaxID=3364761 RepID=UPI00367F9C16
MTVVDVHAHTLPSQVLAGDWPPALAAGLRTTEDGRLLSPTGERLPAHYPDLTDPAAALARMDRQGVDRAVVSLTPHAYAVGTGPEATRYARAANDALAAYVGSAAAAGRLTGLATLPVGRPEDAAAELERAITRLGLAGAQITTGPVAGRPLDHAGLDPLFTVCETLDVPLSLHPSYCGPLQDPDLFLHNSIGAPLDTALAYARLAASGTLDRHPRLRLVLAHGGGVLAQLLPRLDNNWHYRADLRTRAHHPPSAYLDRVWCDTVVHTAPALRYLKETFGEPHLLLGTDAPYGTGVADPVPALEQAGLNPHTLGEAAERLFRSVRSGPTATGRSAETVVDLREEIIRLESSLLGAEARNDVDRLEQLIHHDFYEIGRTGKYWEREEVIRVLNSIPDQVRGMTFDRVVELAPGVAHIRFRTEDAVGVVHRSSIWTREDGRWQQRYHQGTPDTQAG